MTHRQITNIRVYWDSQDPRNEGWAYRACDDNGLIASGGIEASDDDLDGAIEAAVSELGIELRADQFAREPHQDGGWAEWDQSDEEDDDCPVCQHLRALADEHESDCYEDEGEAAYGRED
jgi:hypothetical protein